jgi:hypothetical protein
MTKLTPFETVQMNYLLTTAMVRGIFREYPDASTPEVFDDYYFLDETKGPFNTRTKTSLPWKNDEALTDLVYDGYLEFADISPEGKHIAFLTINEKGVAKLTEMVKIFEAA